MSTASRAFAPPFHIPFVRETLATPSAKPARQPGDDYAIAEQREEEIAAALAAATPAAVLIGLIEREHGTTVLLTERATHLRSHSGQVAFPGGKIDPGEDALAAA
ncbi:MAG: NUDIX domain-containing protein, partial [Rhodoblastus sp.]|nr:NUDIX domain-containing protein [Rhodoblastus sp.]